MVLFVFVPVCKKRRGGGIGPVSTVGAGWGWCSGPVGSFVLVTVVNKVIVAGFFGNRGRGLGNLDVL